MITAYELMKRENLEKSLASIEEKREEQKMWWEARRQRILDELLGEFGEEDLSLLQKTVGGGREENQVGRKRKDSALSHDTMKSSHKKKRAKAKGKGKK